MDNLQSIAAALEQVKKITRPRGVDIIQSKEIKRADRELLIRANWLQEIMRGWYMLVRPDIAANDSAAWYANFWDFLSVYLGKRFGKNYCLSAESSLGLYTEASLIPKQVIVVVPKGGSNNFTLLYDTSLLIYADSKNFPSDRRIVSGLQGFSLEAALCKVAPTYFKNNHKDAEIALRLVKSPSEISKVIIKGNLKSAGNRLVGAYQFLGEQAFARIIKEDLDTVGFSVKPENPFAEAIQEPRLFLHKRIRSPYAARIEALWVEVREHILAIFPKTYALPKNTKKYLTHVDEIYTYDAYNSLSIEGYQVTLELIEKVKHNKWNPDLNPEDHDTKNALAAKGYYEAFQEVKRSVEKVLKGENAAEVFVHDLQNWYRKLFLPNVQAGIIKVDQLIGYRNDRVHIRGSRHVPPPKDAVVDSMETLCECIKKETHPAVQAILGHYLFVFIHPYMDGNGRMARFLMNVMFAGGGYPWTIIENKNRKKYMQVLKIADEECDLKPFAKFILHEMQKFDQNRYE